MKVWYLSEEGKETYIITSKTIRFNDGLVTINTDDGLREIKVWRLICIQEI